MYNDTPLTALAYVEAAYSAMQAAVIFYDGLRARSRMNESTLTELQSIKRAIRHAMLDNQDSQTSLRTSVDSVLGTLRQLISSLRGSSPRSTSTYPYDERWHMPSDGIDEQLVQYLNNAKQWLEVVESQAGEGASNNSRTLDAQQYHVPNDTQDYYTDYYTNYYCRL